MRRPMRMLNTAAYPFIRAVNLKGSFLAISSSLAKRINYDELFLKIMKNYKIKIR